MYASHIWQAISRLFINVAIHHSARRWQRMQAKDCAGISIKWCSAFTDQRLAIAS
jgi:hypothetical protein